MHPIARHAGRWMFGGVGVYALATVVFGLSTSFVLSGLALVAIGAGLLGATLWVSTRLFRQSLD